MRIDSLIVVKKSRKVLKILNFSPKNCPNLSASMYNLARNFRTFLIFSILSLDFLKNSADQNPSPITKFRALTTGNHTKAVKFQSSIEMH